MHGQTAGAFRNSYASRSRVFVSSGPIAIRTSKIPGLTVSPGIFEVLIAMGPELTNERLRQAYEYLKAPGV